MRYLYRFYLVCKLFFESCKMPGKKRMDKKRLKSAKLFVKYLFLRVQEAMILRSASALSYTTLLAVVPFLAIVMSVFTIFPTFAGIRQQVQELLIQYLMPDVMENVQHYMTVFIKATSKLTTLGAVGIAVTAVLMLSTIESSFNFIFQVKRHRKITTKIWSYFFIIVICPLLLGVALYLKGYLLTIKYLNGEHLMGFGMIFTIILPQLLTFGVLWLAYILVPNRKVHPINACWGALAACVMMFILRVGFGYFLVLNVTYKTIYGALATVPVLLVWMYLWWTVVLSGAILTAALAEFKNRRGVWYLQKKTDKI